MQEGFSEALEFVFLVSSEQVGNPLQENMYQTI